MTDEKKALIVYRLECADEMMSDSWSLVGEERWKSAVSRLYYAVFQAVSRRYSNQVALRRQSYA